MAILRGGVAFCAKHPGETRALLAGGTVARVRVRPPDGGTEGHSPECFPSPLCISRKPQSTKNQKSISLRAPPLLERTEPQEKKKTTKAEGYDRACNRQEKTWGSKQGNGEVSEKSQGKRVKVPVDSIPKAHTWLPDGALASGVQSCGRERGGRLYTAVAQDAKMDILG